MDKKFLVVIAVGVIIISALSLFSFKNDQSSLEEKTALTQGQNESKLVLVIDNGQGSPQTLEADFKEGMTAFDLLKEETEKSGVVLETKSYDIGIFIETIGDVKNGQDDKYWLYYINGTMPQVASDKQVLKAGDKVEFKFEKSSF